MSSRPAGTLAPRSNARRREAVRATLWPALALALLGASCRGTDALRPLPEPIAPPGPVRVPAEWEPARGAVVVFPFAVPDALVQALAEKDTLFVLVAGEDQDALREALKTLEIRRRSYETIACTATEAYPRDFGPLQIVDGDGQLAVLDQIFQGYPIYTFGADRGRTDAPIEFLPDEGGEDEVAQASASHLDLRRYVAPIALTGGNFLVDGAGTAFFTDALVDENLAWHDRATFFDLVERFTGCANLVHLPNVEEVGIQHVDCWLKPLPGGRLLVQEAPADHPASARLEAAVRELADARDANGRPFEILRVPCPVVDREQWGDEAPLAAYTNSLILNQRVYVPLYGVPGDEVALDVWRRALPDHEVLGFLDAKAEGIEDGPVKDWQSYDALHCRTRAIFDAGALAGAASESEPTTAAEPGR
ncbi:Peptidylarginine deiminase precursor [Planctomycetes bacterium Pla163]|uniref:Peptidylarginine deiminase n=1 Tax=Rohdeia mirabilis TaxID=2528008 RepID=A0A518D283_9BACT|nr:Peptidylarginine deiminase precursor [Planctomycetes bacterium Pla163]